MTTFSCISQEANAERAQFLSMLKVGEPIALASLHSRDARGGTFNVHSVQSE